MRPYWIYTSLSMKYSFCLPLDLNQAIPEHFRINGAEAYYYLLKTEPTNVDL